MIVYPDWLFNLMDEWGVGIGLSGSQNNPITIEGAVKRLNWIEKLCNQHNKVDLNRHITIGRINPLVVEYDFLMEVIPRIEGYSELPDNYDYNGEQHEPNS